MTKKCCIQTNPDLGILLIRFALALVFIIHGLAKFQAMPSTITFFSTLGLVPFMAYFIAVVEFFGGILLLLGMFTPWTALVLGINMFFAILLVKLDKPFLAGYEYDLTLMLVSFGLSLLGTGKYTVCPCRKERKH
jgi:putative oxidoreductase